jgi:hypothetical protein
MKTLTSESVTFRRPFAPTGTGELLPAGTYSVETEDELIEGVPYLAYRHLSTLLRPRLQPGSGHQAWAIAIDPDDLGVALARDQVTAEAPATATPPRQEQMDRCAVEHAENEGLAVRPA